MTEEQVFLRFWGKKQMGITLLVDNLDPKIKVKLPHIIGLVSP